MLQGLLVQCFFFGVAAPRIFLLLLDFLFCAAAPPVFPLLSLLAAVAASLVFLSLSLPDEVVIFSA